MKISVGEKVSLEIGGLRFDILRREHDRVLVREGLKGGERVAISRLAIPVEGMRVRPLAPGAALDAPAAPERAP